MGVTGFPRRVAQLPYPGRWWNATAAGCLGARADKGGVRGPPGWRVHRLSGGRTGTWSINVSGNWRIAFEIESGDVAHLDLEDYHWWTGRE